MTLLSIPANPVPDRVVTGTIRTPDGADLRFARWEPPAGRKGTVCVFTGRAECIEKYFETVRDLREVHCASRDPAKREAFVAEARRALPGLRIVSSASPQEAVRDADIVTTITTSSTPVVLGEWLAPGTHCNAMGQHAPATRELDTQAIRDADVYVDAREQAFAEKGEILLPMAEGAIGRDHVKGELGEVVAGRVAGRTSNARRTVFCSGGTALEYMTLCATLIDKARDAGIGQHLNDGGDDD